MVQSYVSTELHLRSRLGCKKWCPLIYPSAKHFILMNCIIPTPFCQITYSQNNMQELGFGGDADGISGDA